MIGFGSALWRNTLALLVAAPLLVVALVRLFGADRFWPLVPAVAFTPQVALLLVVLLVICLVVRARVAALICALVLAMLVGVLAPRVIGSDGLAGTDGGSSAAAAPTFKLLSANLRLGQSRPSALAAIIRRERPDVIALQEATPWYLDRLRALGVMRRYRHIVDHSAWGSIGYATLSLTPLRELPRSGLGRPASDGVSGSNGPWPEMRVGGSGVLLRNIHPQPPITPQATSRWQQRLAAIPPARERLRVVTGDFNATLDHHAFRDVLTRGYRDAGAISGNGLTWTWRSGILRRLVLDHVLIPSGVGVSDYRVLELAGSDHRALVVTLRLPVR